MTGRLGRTHGRGRGRAVLLLLLGASASALAAGAARAARIETGAACSIAEAIESANTNAAVGGCAAGAAGRDTVVLVGAATLSAPDNGTNGLPVIVEDLVITSPDPAVQSSVSRDFTVGTPEFRLIEIGTAADAPAVTLRRIALRNGRVRGAITPGGVPAAGAGGCVFLRNGTLTVVDSVFEECTAVGADNPAGPASDAWGGAIAAVAGSLTVRGSSFALNAAVGGVTQAADQPGGRADGGAIFATGLDSVVVRDSSLSSNFATGGVGIDRAGVGRGGAMAVFGTDATLTGSTLLANAAVGGVASGGTSGTGIGGAVAIEGGTLGLTASELADNVARGAASATSLAGHASGGAFYGSSATLTIARTAFARNRAIGGTGATPSLDGVPRGGGLFLWESPATLDALTVEDNSATGGTPAGGGIAVLHEDGAATPVVVTRSRIAGNSATATQGAATGGGLYQDGDTVSLRNTALEANAADSGGGLFQESGAMLIASSALTGNSAGTRGGGLAIDGDLFAGNSVAAVNTTISGNSAALAGGGLYVKAVAMPPEVAEVALTNVTLSANSGGGIWLVEDRTQPVLTVANSIVGAQADGGDCVVEGTAQVVSAGGNLESAADCGFTAASDLQSVADLGLAPLGENGGRTPTHDLLAGSPAIDGGRAAPCPNRDQRALARFYDGDGDGVFACDSGAVEAQGLLANPGFEEPLSAADWTLVASGGGDGRLAFPASPNGGFALALVANEAVESLSQSVPVAGAAGADYALTLQALGAGMTAGETLVLTLRATLVGAPVDTAACAFAFPSPDFAAAPACGLVATGDHDALEATLGWDGATAGTLTLDAVSLAAR
jgi:hypothetical protein